jgi:hypothetical protein
MAIRKLDYPAVSKLLIKTENGVDKTPCYDFIAEYIENVLIFFGEEWKSTTIYDTAETIYADYYYLTLADWKLIAQRIKASHYGKVYGKFTPSVLMDWISLYAGEWTQTSIDISLSGHDLHKALNDPRDARAIEKESEAAKNFYAKLITIK